MRIGFAGLVGACAVVLAASACEKPEFEPPDRAQRVMEAAGALSANLFDSVAWVSDELRAQAGNEVYAAKCRNCHGPLGSGDTEYARSRGIEVPSLVDRDWHLDGALDSIRVRIFVGHEAGMPTWGIAGITPREIDGAAFYVLEQLRPDVLGG